MRKKLISALVALILALSLAPIPAYAADNPYVDVSTNDWFYPAVEYMSTRKHMTGYDDTHFGPRDTLNRAMFVTVLYRTTGEHAAPTNTFSDVPQNMWYSEAVAWAVANGITDGTGGGKFSPESPVTRQEMAVFLKRYVDKRNIDLSEHSVVVSTPTDLSACSDWAADAVSFACQFGFLYENTFLTGTSSVGGEHKVNPRSNATRTEAVVAFYNLLHAYARHALLPGGMAKMTLKQECPEDPNREFVYYIPAGGSASVSGLLGAGAYIEPSQPHVEKMEHVRWNRCDCGYVIFSCQQHPTETWENHSIDCKRNYIYGRDTTLYKITLKHGEQIELTPYGRSILYPEQDIRYSLSYSTDGTHFVEYVDRLSLWEDGGDLSVAHLRFAVLDKGALTIKWTPK